MQGRISTPSRPTEPAQDPVKYQIDIWGTDGDDVIYGNAVNNRLYGKQGSDVFMGDPGADQFHGDTAPDTPDTANYSNSGAGVIVDLAAEADRGLGYGGDAEGDELYSIENVVGSSYSDRLYGDSRVNVLDGGDGNDTLYGRGGNDTLIGGKGNDVLAGGTGADKLQGGEGIDTAGYADAGYTVLGGVQVGVTADLAAGKGGFGDAYGDTYESIENLTGSAYSDWLYGDDNANVIGGGGGVDYLYGRGGTDTLAGGSGDDVLMGGIGADHLDGGSGRDMADYSDSASGIQVWLSNVSPLKRYIDAVDPDHGYFGEPEFFGHGDTSDGDTFYSVEDVNGSAYNDLIAGTAAANRMYGNGGNDTFFGDGGADHFDGGAGTDTAKYYHALSSVTADLANGGSTGDAAGDTYVSIENLVGSRWDNNALYGNGADNRIESHGRFDVVDGRGGSDRIELNSLFSEASGGTGDDRIEFRWQSDSDAWSGIVGSHEANIDGGDNIDTVEFAQYAYSTVDAGVRVDLNAGTYVFEGRVYDVGQKSIEGEIANVENVHGTANDDFIFGNGLANELHGNDGNDTLRGDAGNDILNGGRGADVLDGGIGFDAVSYLGSAAVEVSLSGGVAHGGDAEGDTLIDIENLQGSNAGDILEGNDADNVIDGAGGSDIIDGAGGNDSLIGGAGADEFVFGLEFHFQESHATVEDFEIGVDQLNLSHLDGIDSYADAMAGFTQVGAHAVFTYADSTITLENVQLSSLTANDFLL